MGIEFPVTALMSVKNGEGWFLSARLGIVSNMGEMDEIILIDDGSTDLTLELMNKWAETDTRVRVLQNPNPGLANALNLGLNTARNEWIARFDVDDQYEEYRVREQRKLISDEVVAIFCDYTVRDSEGNLMGEFLSAVDDRAIRISLVRNLRTPHPGALIRKSAALSVGGYLQSDFPAEDLSLWLRLMPQGKFASVPMPLFTYTLNGGSVTGLRRKEMISKRVELISRNQELSNYPKDLQEISYSLRALYAKTENGTGRTLLLIFDGVYLCKVYGNTLTSVRFALREILPLMFRWDFYKYIVLWTIYYARRRSLRNKLRIA